MPAETPGLLNTPLVRDGINYQCTYNTSAMGLVDTVDPTGLKLVLKPITTGSTGKDNTIGMRVAGVNGSIKVQFRQLNLAMYQSLLPWNAGAVPAQLVPPLNTDLYQFALPLIFHPLDMGAATTEDITYGKAVPISLPTPKRDGGGIDMLEIEFAIFPDRAAFQTSYGAMSVGNIKGT